MPLNYRFVLAFSALLLLDNGLAEAAPGGFNPRGRTKSGSPSKSRTAKSPTTRSVDRSVAPPNVAQRSGSRTTPAALIARYTKIVRQKPGAPFPLKRLVQLIRERDGKLDRLIVQIEGLPGQGARLTLAGLLVHDEQLERANRLYQEIVQKRPHNATARSQWAMLLARQNQFAEAIATLQPVVGSKLSRTQRDDYLQLLIRWALDAHDLLSAQKFHRARTQRAGGSFFIESELGRQLMDRRMFSEAESEYRRVLKTARSDPRTFAPALRNLGQSLLAQSKHEEAIESLTKLQTSRGRTSGTRREIDALIATAFRALNRMPELIAREERSKRTDAEHWLLLAELYEEGGRLKDAAISYEKSLKLRPRATDARLALIQLLQLQGELARALRHQQLLVRQAPNNPQYALRLAEAYLQSGKRDRALAGLAKLEQKSKGNEETLTTLIHTYQKMGEADRALSLLQRLAKSNPARHLVQLGEHYFSAGKTETALKTWKLLLPKGDNNAQAFHRLGEVYLDHDLPELAVAVLDRAHRLDPTSRQYTRSLAIGLEKSALNQALPRLQIASRKRAQLLWQSLQREAGKENQPHRAREARQHIISLWSSTKTLQANSQALLQKLHGTPPDLEAGRLLAEAQIRQRQYTLAQSSLEKILTHAPGDTSSRRALEQVLVRQGQWDQAIEVLKQLAQSDPGRAKEYFEQIARHAEKLYRDELALEFSIRAVQLAPEDARGHLRLANRYRARQQLTHATREYRLSLRYNPRLYSAHFQLAEVLVHKEKFEEAERHLRHIVRESLEEEQISRAARRCLQLHLGGKSLRRLEADLLPLALGNPQRPVYRRLLAEIYDELTRPLEVLATGSDSKKAEAAHQQLIAIGRRAVKPLLDTLGDRDAGQQQVALLLLSVLKNKDAGPALLRFADSTAPTRLRLQAMAAVAALQDPQLLQRLEKFLWQKGYGVDERDPVHNMAAWAVARVASPEARPLLNRLLEEASPTLQTLAILGLDAIYRSHDAAKLAALANSSAHASLPRVAAAWVLAHHSNRQAIAATSALSSSVDPLISGVALNALASLKTPDAATAIASALLLGSPELAQFAMRAACRQAPKQAPGNETAVTHGPLNAGPLLVARLPPQCTGETAMLALLHLKPALLNCATDIATTGGKPMLAVAYRLRNALGEPSLMPLSEPIAQLTLEEQAPARKVLSALTDLFLGGILEQSRHTKVEQRRKALNWLAPHPSDQAQEVLINALHDRDSSIQSTALALLERYPRLQAVPAVTRQLRDSPSWAIRRLAARTLRSANSIATASEGLVKSLTRSALSDPYALVRNEAARSLQAVSPQAARSVLESLAHGDSEPEVRENARQLLEAPREP